MNTGSDVSGVVQFDHADYARRWLSDSEFFFDFEVVVAEDNQLILDYDSPAIPEQFYVTLDILKQVLSTECLPYEVSESKSGNVHVIITLPYSMSDVRRVAWQAAFGSDPKREALHLLSIAKHEKNPILLYNRKKTQLHKLTKVHANGAPINVSMVMIALVEAMRDRELPAYARMHEAQRVSWHNCAVMAGTVGVKTDELPVYPFIKETVGGVPIVVDDKLWPAL